MANQPDQPSSPPPSAPIKKRWPWSRIPRIIRALAILLVALGCGYWLLTGSFVTRWIVLSQAQRILGGPVTARSVELWRDGRLVIQDAVLRAPNIEGTAGNAIEVERIEAKLHYWSIFTGSPRVIRVDLTKPRARLSQNTDPGPANGELNFAALSSSPGSGSFPMQVPAIFVHDGAIELGEHGKTVPNSYRMLRSIAVGGEVEQSTDATGEMRIRFRQTSQGPIPTPIDVQGSIGKQGLTLELTGFALDGWDVASMPAPSRDFFARLDMQGRIDRIVFNYRAIASASHPAGIDARIGLADVALTLPAKVQPDVDLNSVPLPLDPVIANNTLRMTSVSGEIQILGETVTASLTGNLAEIPFHVEANVRGLFADAGLSATMTIKNFDLGKQPKVLLFAPGVVRRRLLQFDDPTGNVNATVLLTRADPIPNPDASSDSAAPKTIAAPVEIKGSVNFTDVTAAFERFPYRFIEMAGIIDFTDTTMNMRDITGTTIDGAQMTAHVEISPLDKDAGVNVHVRVVDMSIDERLASAMKARRRIVDSLFSPRRLDELRAAGLIATHADAESALRTLTDLNAQGRADSDEARKALEVLERPRFTLGGKALVVVDVQRIKGPGANWHDHVVITPGRLGVLPDSFPYPMWVEGAVIDKLDTIATVTGGTYTSLARDDEPSTTAKIAARVDFSQVDDPSQPFLPEVEVDAKAIPLNRILRHAAAALIEEEPKSAPDLPTPGLPPTNLTNLNSISPTSTARSNRIREALLQMTTTGTADVRARIGPKPIVEGGPPRSPEDRVDYDVRAKLNDVSILPPVPNPAGTVNAQGELSPRVRIFGIDGTFSLAPGIVKASLEGALVRLANSAQPNPDPPNPALPNPALPNPSALSTDIPTAADITLETDITGESMSVKLAARGLDVSAAIEDAAGIAFPDAHAEITRLRSELAPTGHADLTLTLMRGGTIGAADVSKAPDSLLVTLEVTKINAIEVAALDGRTGATTRGGKLFASMPITFTSTSPTAPATDAAAQSTGNRLAAESSIRFDDLALELTYDRVPAGTTIVHGALHADGSPLRASLVNETAVPDANPAEPATEPVTIRIEGGVLESGLTRNLLASLAPGIATTLADFDAGGLFDANVRLMPAQPDPAASTSKAWFVEADVFPQSLAATIDGTRVQALTTSGKIEVRGTQGRIIDAVLNGSGWTLRGDGSWLSVPATQAPPAPDADGSLPIATGTAVQARVAIDAKELTPEIVGALPKNLREALARANAKVPGGVALEAGELTLGLDPASAITAMRVAGRVRMANGEADLGVSLRELTGVADFEYVRDIANAARLEVVATGNRLRVGGVQMTDARLRLTQGPDGKMYMPMFSANCHGGRISGTGSLTAEGTGANLARTVHVETSASSVRLASLIIDLGATNAEAEAIQNQQPATSAKADQTAQGDQAIPAIDATRGLLDASLSVTSTLGDTSTRRGRGMATVGGGRVLSLPLLVPLVRVSNLQPPVDELLDFARAEFYFDNVGINFEELTVSSKSVEIYGFGTARWPDANLDLRFRSRAKTRIPVISSVLEGIRDELVTAVVEGPIASPSVTVTTLTGTTRFISRVFGLEPSEQERRLEEIQKRVDRARTDAPIKRDDAAPVEPE